MKALFIALVFAVLSMGCEQTIYAQTLPVTLTIAWDARPASENVTSYDVQLDAGPIVAVAASANPSTPITVTTAGSHVISVWSKSVWLSCADPTQCNTVALQSSAPATLAFTITTASPGKVLNPKLTKP